MIAFTRAWILIGVLSIATALSFLGRQVLSVLAPRITAEFGMTNTEYSRVVFVFVLSYTAMFSAGGRLMDYLGTNHRAETLRRLAEVLHIECAVISRERGAACR